MGLNARDMLLIVRAENQASGALKRVARDVGSLSNMRGLKQRGQQLQINKQTLLQSRQRAEYEAQSIADGKRALAMERAKANLANSGIRAALQKSGVEKAALANQRQLLTNEVTISRLQKSASAKGLTKFTRDQYAKQLKAAQIATRELQMETGRLEQKAGLAAGALNKQAIATKELAAREVELAHRGEVLQAQIATRNNQLALNSAKIRENNRAIRDAKWDRVSAAGSAIQHTARVAQYAGLVIGAGLGVAAKAAADFNTQATFAATQVGNKFKDTVKAAKQISAGVLDIAKSGKTIASTADQNAAAYDIFSSMTLSPNQGQAIKMGMSILRQFNRAAIAGQVDLKDVTNAGVVLLNNFAKQGNQAKALPAILNRMFAAVRYGKMTVQEFVSSMGQVAPAFSTAFGSNQKSFDMLAGAMATITRYMPKMGMASAGLSRMLEIFQRPDFIAGFQKLYGKNLAPGGHLLPLDILLADIDKAVPKLKKGGIDLQNFFKLVTAAGSKTGKGGTNATVQARRALQELVIHQKEYHTLQRQVIFDNNEFSKSFRNMSDTSGVKWKEFTQQIHAFAIEIGESVIPVIGRLSEPIRKAIDWWDKLDKSTKDTIGRWVAYGAVFTLLGSGVLWLGGTFLRLYAILGRGTGMFGSLLITVVAITAAVQLLSGNWDGLNGIINTFVSFGTDSIQGWTIMLGGAAIAALKLSNALKAVAASEAVARASSLLGRGRGALGEAETVASSGIILPAGVKGVSAVERDSKSILTSWKAAVGPGAKMTAALEGAGAAALAIPSPLWIAGAAIAVAAGGALIWKRHMEGVKQRTDEVNAVLERNKALSAGPTNAFSNFAGLAGSIGDLLKAKYNLDQYVKAYKDAKAEFAKHPTQTNKDALAVAGVNLAGARNDLAKANDRSNRSFNSLAVSVNKYARAVDIVAGQKQHIQNMKAQRAELEKLDLSYMEAGGPRVYARQIADLSRNIKLDNKVFKSNEAALARYGKAIQLVVGSNVRELVRMGQLPANAGDWTKMLASVTTQMHRFLTKREITMLINAEVDPSVEGKMSAKMRAIFNQVNQQLMAANGKRSMALKPKIKVAPDYQIDKAFKIPKQFTFDSLLKAMGGKQKAVQVKSVLKTPNANPALKDINSFFTKHTPKIGLNVQPPKNLAQIGKNISDGIQSGMHTDTQFVKAFHMDLLNIHKNAIASNSPSRLYAREIGKPIVEGIAMGMAQNMATVSTAAKSAVNVSTDTRRLASANGKKIGNLYTSSIAMGMIEKRGDIQKQAMLTLELFSGTLLSNWDSTKATKIQLERAQHAVTIAEAALKRKHGETKANEQRLKIAQDNLATLQAKGKPVTVDVLTRDLASQYKNFKKFNDAIAALVRRHVPKQLVAELESLGADGAKNIAMLAGASDKQLKKYVALWRRTQKEVGRSAHYMASDVKTALKGLAKDAGQTLLDTWNGIHDQMTGFMFADMFTGMEDKFGQGFKDATDNYNNQMQDYRSQLKDLNSQLAQANTDETAQIAQIMQDAMDQAKQAMQSSFGDLFSGDWMNSDAVKTKIDWGQALGMDDLTKDLQGQLDKFNHWQSDLTALAKKLPKKLVEQLAALGPDAIKELDTLNGATKDQLKQYTDLWLKGQSAIGRAASKSVMNSDDLQKQIAQVQKDATKNINDILSQIDEVSKKMGELNQPQELTGADLQKWIDDQISGWKDWQGTLSDLQKRGLPAELVKQLADMGPQAEPYLKALNSMTQDQLMGKGGFVDKWKEAQDLVNRATDAAMTTQLQVWYDYGSNSALQFIAGVSSQQQALVDYFTNLFSYMLDHHKAPPVNTGGGGSGGSAGGGKKDKNGQYRGPGWSSYTDASSGKGYSVVNYNYDVNMPVTAHHDESLSSTLSRAAFRMKQGNPK